MARSARTRPVTIAQARQYLSKAGEFLAAAEDSLASDRCIAATGNAVHAGINASDAVCGIRLQKRAASADHATALVLLKKAGPDGTDLAKHLARLLPLKGKAEYDPDDIPGPVATKAVETARRAVAVARRVVPAK